MTVGVSVLVLLVSSSLSESLLDAIGAKPSLVPSLHSQVFLFVYNMQGGKAGNKARQGLLTNATGIDYSSQKQNLKNTSCDVAT